MKKLFFVSMFFWLSCLLLNPVSAKKHDSKNPETLLSENLIDLKSNNYLEIQDSSTFQNFLSTLSVAPEALFKTADKVSITFDWVAKRIDTILTKQGAIKTLLILGPLFTLYCYFFSPELVKALISYIVSSATNGASEIADSAVSGINESGDVMPILNEVTQKLGEIQGNYDISYKIGQTSGLWNSMWNSPLSTITYLMGRGIEHGVGAGIPFGLGLLAQKWIKP